MDYANGKIYKLVSNVIPDIYIGSSTTELKKRKYCHKRDYGRWKKGSFNYISSFKLFEAGEVEIVLIESFPCASKDELFARERFWIESTVCVNKNIPGRTVAEYREQNKDKLSEYQKEYREQNKDKISERQKEYYEQNRDKLLERTNEYRTQNRDRISERAKQYRVQNKEKLAEQRNKTILCDKCGKEISKTNLSRHKKTKECLSSS